MGAAEQSAAGHDQGLSYTQINDTRAVSAQGAPPTLCTEEHLIHVPD